MWGRIDILVNNAGICQVIPVDQIEEKDWDRMFAVNVKGVFLCSKALMGIMMKQKSGKIINLGSLGRQGGRDRHGSPLCRNQGHRPLLHQISGQVPGPAGCPGQRPGARGDRDRYDPDDHGGDWKNFLATIPLGRIGHVKEVGKAAVFLASDDSSYLTGEVIDINGGQSMD
jgi:NAD(P)-dependent dehydrogenase (short-subunit alcohol dehydrogenase family)